MKKGVKIGFICGSLLLIIMSIALVSLTAATVTYQAENASYGGSVVTETTNTGFNGSAYLNFPSSGGYVQFNNVDGGSGGAATLQIRSALGSTSSRTGRYQVNGGSWVNITFNPTGAWTTWSPTTVNINLNSGTGNTIRLESTGQDLANIDEITVVSSGGSSTPTPTLSTATPTPTSTTGGSISIACGSSSAVGSFQADQYYSGGSAYSNSNTVDVSQITSNPPPAALFNNERYGAMSYTIPGFTAGNSYTVTLYFAETYLTSSGSRLFNVSINGSEVLSNFDIYVSAGGQNKAIARSFTTTANSNGQIVIQFSNGSKDNAKINGISIQPGSSNPTPTPTRVVNTPTVSPTPTRVVNTPTPTPTPGSGSISIAAGSSSAVGSFQADQYYSGGSAYSNTNTVDVSQITSNPPPAALFNNERYGAMSYTFPGFTGGSSYVVTLYFAETYLTSSGSRLFNVSINGATVLSNFDIYASAGGQNKAIAYSFTTTANASGQIVIQFSNGSKDNAKINGISIQPGSFNPTPTQPYTPTPTPTNGNTPTPTRGNTPTPTNPPGNARQMENLDRGVVAVKVSNGVFVSWRVLGTENSSVSYNLYRGSTKVNSSPLTVSNYVDTAGTTSSTYTVRAVVNGSEQGASPTVSTWGSNYLSIPISPPSSIYSANDCSVGDLDGDHQYEIVLKWDPSDAKDNSQSGTTSNVYIDAYKLNGTRMWRINLGRNIRAGAHYTQFMVYDLDGDGKAEMVCKTADGTTDGRGTVIGSSSADYRNSNGYILSGPEYLTVFNGQTGAAMATVNYEPARGTVSSWGDDYGNRVDRFLACVAYLDGVHPSVVMCRGYYTRAVLVAYDWRNGSLTKRWTFDTNNGYSSYTGQGNHNLSVGDVDQDGKDEIIYGACAINDNGSGMYSTGLGHGDALHLGDFNPDRAGLEVWQCHEGGSGATFRDARTGSVIFKFASSGDVGRACCDDMTATRGCEMWASGSSMYNCTGGNAGSSPSSCNFVVWWDGDPRRELLDGTTISKYGGSSLLSASGCASNNGTKSTPCLSADILGDWREEVILRTSDNTALRIYTTTTTTSSRIYTLMHDPQYRVSIAWQNVAYNQPPHVGFYLGEGMNSAPTPNIYLAP